jgi:hypothetical protein
MLIPLNELQFYKNFDELARDILENGQRNDA